MIQLMPKKSVFSIVGLLLEKAADGDYCGVIHLHIVRNTLIAYPPVHHHQARMPAHDVVSQPGIPPHDILSQPVAHIQIPLPRR